MGNYIKIKPDSVLKWEFGKGEGSQNDGDSDYISNSKLGK